MHNFSGCHFSFGPYFRVGFIFNFIKMFKIILLVINSHLKLNIVVVPLYTSRNKNTNT